MKAPPGRRLLSLYHRPLLAGEFIMAKVYYSRFLGDRWSSWDGGFELPPFPPNFDPESCTVSFARRDGVTWCYVFEPENSKLVWCSWDGYEWTDWEGRVTLHTAPNDLIDDEEAFYSVSTHDDMEWMVAYNVEDGSVFWAPWGDHGFGAWEGDEDLVDDPPNFDDETDVFVAGDGGNEWLLSVNMEDMSVFYAEWEGEEFSDWTRAPDLFIPEEWLDYVDLDGDATDGRLTIFATVYDEDDEL
jgi:hypothetical protein